tara:strand:+ start:702 stop:1766 length:1065 start_codon:yes stop_codon:yes gene_type:complete
MINPKTSISACFIAVLLMFFTENLYAQANPDPCTSPNTTCINGGGNGIITSFGSKNIIYTSPGRSMPFWVAFGDTLTNYIDTSSNNTYLLSQISGPGQMSGLPAILYDKYIYFNEIVFSQFGEYEIIINQNNFALVDTFTFTVVPEVDFCTSAPGGGCVAVGGNEIFAKPSASNVIPVDAVFPITVGVIDSITHMINAAFIGTIYVEKISGPGVVYGTLSMSGKGWFTFNNIKFNQVGIYTIQFYEGSKTTYKSDTLQVEVVAANSINETTLTPQLNAYPNPFNEQLSIYTPLESSDINISIYDSKGELVLDTKTNGNQKKVTLDTKFLKPGIYILNVNSAKNTIIQNKIIVKY